LPRANAEAALQAAGFAAGTAADYDLLRLSHGIPDGSRDIIIEKSFPLEVGFDELHAIDYDKGCYIGQELTARTHHRGTIRKRLFRVDIDGPLPEPGTPVRHGETEVGVMRSGLDGIGLALLRIEQVEAAAKAGEALSAGGARLTPVKPDWASF
jgi:folate-binding protein YgfZ